MEDTLQARGTVRALPEQAGIVEQALVGEGLEAAAQADRPHTDEVEEARPDGVQVLAPRARVLVTDRRSVFLPRPVEERDEPMVEEGQEVAERRILLASALEDQLGVMMRQHTQRARQTHERHSHLGRSSGRRPFFELVDGARWKTQRGMGLETDDFVSRTRTAADGRAMAIEPFEHTDGLEEIEPIALVEEGVG